MAFYHIHKRKRVHQKGERYPHPRRSVRMLDAAVMATGILAPIMALPQLWRIWSHQSAAGVSLWTWGGYLLIAMVWALYGIVHRERVVMVKDISQAFVFLIIVIGLLMYQ